MKKFLFFIFICFVFSTLCACFYLRAALLKPLDYSQSVTFEVYKGQSVQKLADELTRRHFAPHPLLVRLAMRFYGLDTRLKAGEYLLTPNMSLKDILLTFTSGNVIMHRLTLPEGLTTAQMLALIENNSLLSGHMTENVNEGEMLPETYTFAKGETRNHIILTAKAQMQKALNDAWDNRDPNLPLANKNEFLILASIVEKETGINAERAKVASVFYNRLNINMPLQTDPTVIYALTLGKSDLKRSLKRKDLEIESPYNTYKNKGLPPTPICNPGIKALQAVAHPETTPYFYFVADGNGGHRFATTLNEHNQNIRLWLKK